MIVTSHSAEETFLTGKRLGAEAKPGGIYCLTGDLGAGKTVFAKGFGKGLGVEREITSPTFIFLNEYKGRIPFYHFDVYRVGSPEDMEDIGFEEYLFGGGVCLVEWAELVEELIPAHAVWIEIRRTGEHTRDIEMKGGAE